VEEGHYRTAVKTLNNIRKELRKTGFNPVAAFKNVKGEMTLEEYKNFKRVGVEFATLMLMYAIANMIMGDDDEDDSYLTTASKLIYMRTFGEFNSTNAVGLPGLASDQLKDPVVILSQYEAVKDVITGAATGDMEQVKKNVGKLTLPYKRYKTTTNVKQTYADYLFYNKDILLGTTLKDEE
jgi:hypothetical protein